MPPPRSTKPRLTKEQVAIFKRWIDEGAEYSEHWSFIPLKRPKPPAVEESSPKMDAIDAFVNRRLKAEGVEPMAHPLPLGNHLEADDVRPSLEAEQVLDLAPEVEGDFLVVPKVIGEGGG